MNKKVLISILLFCYAASCQAAFNSKLEQQREIFLRAEQMLENGQKSLALQNLALLQDYPLYPYLKYRMLKRNLHMDNEIQQFLIDYKESRYAAPLRKGWLDDLAKRGRWRDIVGFYQRTNDSASQCQYQWAKYKTGKTGEALLAAKQLWLVGRSQPKQCDLLFDAMTRSGYLNEQMIWQRFDLALREGNVGLAAYLKKLLGKKDRQTAGFWLKVHDNPSLVIDSYWQNFYSHQGAIFTHAIDRMASSDPVAAIRYWDLYKNKFSIKQPRRQQIERRLALALAFKKDPMAYFRLSQLPDSDATVREWRVRAALSEQNWQHVAAALQRLTPAESQTPEWLYWRGRALANTGNPEQARKIFEQAAKDRSYYGFLAADSIRRNYHFADQPIIVQPGSMEALLAMPGFQAVNEFRNLGRTRDAHNEWWFAVNKLDKAQLKTAAKLAQQWQWNHIAAFTVARAEYWDDLALRFPVIYSAQIHKNAALRDIDPVVVFGLIRQESAFNQNAQSPVGAAGLMQIMPRTGKQIAGDLRERWRSGSSLFDPELNIRYGTYYYKQLLDQFDGHFALAAAAYNAGPHRVKRWLPEQGKMPADIWVETIPFAETRKYVGRVLAYAMIYQHRIGRNALSMKSFMLDVYPDW